MSYPMIKNIPANVAGGVSLSKENPAAADRIRSSCLREGLLWELNSACISTVMMAVFSIKEMLENQS
ncbi:hypothetical protein POX_h09549 [Penicillium oxalicum]|uniref:hypothetical protein n=1 Tax=Penicillium oxalicum TaxID=69781 RepID=UPI0020B86668|nr:hypothetical protein POX_h09549 [Penicillium oxalicum]KAI2785790.1 hypothetical protein POX_h09549 [Penicillium oxalicum]